jgi:hypothetical protein
MSTPTAGWYPAPGESGMMRYWSDAGWTEHRQPLPPTQPEPTSIHLPASSFGAAGSAPALTAAAPSTWSPVGIVDQLKAVAADKENQAIGTSIAGGALIADGALGLTKNGGGLKGSLGTIAFGIIWLLFTGLFLGPMTDGAKPAPGETTSQGQISDLRTDRTGQCTPLATFAADGKTYQAGASYSSKPCDVSLGETVTVIYNASNPTGSARLAPPAKTNALFGIFPWVGWGVIALGVFGLIKNVSFIAGGIVLLRKGLKDRKLLKSS